MQHVVREDGQSAGSNGAAFVPDAASLGSSEVERTEGGLEAAEVVIHVDGPTFAEAGLKYLKSASKERRGVLLLLYKNDES
ncbi:hypothetical protein L3Q82_024407 [Scortum barcoo]|uniref:Uncharacterized protein n=1 Tax=Scortum barcoo TaxID=214431 RepID=A0ACB8WNW3_9TELE|nr:hypothetical protein L3Q82_024407 [Scortum barcoo]